MRLSMCILCCRQLSSGGRHCPSFVKHAVDAYAATSSYRCAVWVEMRCVAVFMSVVVCAAPVAGNLRGAQLSSLIAVLKNLERGPPFSIMTKQCHYRWKLNELFHVTTLPPKTARGTLRCAGRSLLVVCSTGKKNSLNYWTSFYENYTRYCGPENFSLLDLTENCDLNLDWWDEAVAPFSYICLMFERQEFLLRVDSDFRGMRRARTALFVPFYDIYHEKYLLTSLMWYDREIHDGPMKLDLTNILDVVLFQMTPKYLTNYSEPGVPVYEQYTAGIYVYDESHYSHAVPLISQSGVAVFLKPRTTYSHLLLFNAFDYVVWLCLIAFTFVMAIIVTVSIGKPANISRWQNFANNVILMFCQTFTSVSVPEPSKFRFSSGAVLAILWSILGIIILTGYKSSLASYLQHPPRAARCVQINKDEPSDTNLFLKTPRLNEVINKLHSGGYWTGNSVSINFLMSTWGLQTDTYTIPYRSESQVLQCLNDGVVFACRSTKRQIRWVFEGCVMFYFLRKAIEGYMSHAVKGVRSTEFVLHDNDKNGHALELSKCLPFFEALFVGLVLSSGTLLFEILTNTEKRNLVHENHNSARQRFKKKLHGVHRNIHCLESR